MRLWQIRSGRARGHEQMLDALACQKHGCGQPGAAPAHDQDRHVLVGDSCVPAIELTIDAGSLDTDNKIRDKHLRSAEFFDVENHPHVRFVSNCATLEGERLTVRSQLCAGGKSMPLDVDATIRRVGDELEVDATTSADHHELGMTHSTLGMIRTPSELVVRGRLTRDTE
jgi:polyisoprenoid-binding protein YceI